MNLNQELISEFWDFIKNNQDKLTYTNYADYYQNKIENIYSEITNRIKTINPGLDIDQTVKIVPTSINSFKQLTIFTITCYGNIHNINLVEEMYQAHKLHNFNGLMITRFIADGFIIPYIRFYDKFISSNLFNYMLNIDTNGLDLIITIDKDVTDMITKDEDITEIRNGCFAYLQNLVGEFIMMKFLTKITVIPKTLFLENYENTTLTNISSAQLKNSIINFVHIGLPETLCKICKTSCFNTDVTDLICYHCSINQ